MVVRTKAHWEAWTFPKDVLDIGEDGQVTPQFVRRNINACQDADQFVHEIDKTQQKEFVDSWYGKDVRKYFSRGGIKYAGSNLEDAALILDNNPHTFWEPDIDASPENWWVEVDLGRLVTATRLVVRFAPEGEGDPFLQFRVLTSMGDRVFGTRLYYIIAGETIQPNKDQRVFEFELSPTAQADEHWTGGRALQYVRVVMTDSDRYRAERVSKEIYESLELDDQGAIEYIWKIGGEELLVERDEYETLPLEEKGEIQYYRREHPRLTEIEVWSAGDNIALETLNRGGSAHDLNKAVVPSYAFDGSYTTYWRAVPYYETGKGAGNGLLTLDLGALFWVDTLRLLINKGKYRSLLDGYVLRVSDGSKASDGTLLWRSVSPRSRQVIWEEWLRIEEAFERQKVRYVEFRNVDLLEKGAGASSYSRTSGGGHIAEFQVYGEGVLPEVELTSDLIELGGSKNITSIEWEADTPPGTRVEIRTRTGDALREIKHYFDKNGVEVTERKYNKLPSFQRGPITSEFMPGSDWSDWSPAYEVSGDPITSPSPRKYLMIQARLLSDDPYASATLDAITIHFAKPVAAGVVGEITPNQDVPAGKNQAFAFFIKPTWGPANPGFDDILLRSPGVEMTFLGASLGRESDFQSGSTEDFLPTDDGSFRSGAGDSLQVIKDRSDSLWVRLPRIVRMGEPDVIQIRFEAAIFLSGTVFEASVGRSSAKGSWQRVDAGDATEWVPGQGTTVFVSLSDQVIGEVEIRPNPFTPNGDGVNDEVTFRFSVFKLDRAKTVEVTICGLDGKTVRRLSSTSAMAAGRYTILWDGTDEVGELVPPGAYLVQIGVRTDSDAAINRSSRVVGVLY